MVQLYKILFFNMLIMSTFLAISAYSWLSAWIGLEINLLSIIPLLKNPNNKYPAESAIKYFITQALASSLFIFTVMIFFLMNPPLMAQFHMTETIFISSALLMKLGAAPFHWWFPEVISGLNWSNSFIMLTWQKIAPMMLLTYHIKTSILFFSIIIISSSMISSLQGLNQVCLRKILAYSSINHMSWMISSLFNSTSIWTYYFITYSIINMNIILVLKNLNMFYLNQLVSALTFKKKMKFFYMLNFMSLGGLPPFLGFFPKWMVINNMISNSHFILAFTLIIFTLLSLYFYLRITFSTYTLYSTENLINIFNKTYFMYFFLNLLSLLGLISCSFTKSFM